MSVSRASVNSAQRNISNAQTQLMSDWNSIMVRLNVIKNELNELKGDWKTAGSLDFINSFDARNSLVSSGSSGNTGDTVYDSGKITAVESDYVNGRE